MDATAPHIVNPLYPEVCEVTVNLGQYCNRQRLFPYREQIIEATKDNKVLYERAYRYVSAASALIADSFRVAAEHTDMAAAARYGARLAEHVREVFEAPGGKERYWDQVPLEYHLDDYTVHVRECSAEDIIEIDTFGELKQIDKTYCM